ncbi:MAG: hypothetical protein P8X85_23265 [Desulfobacterales bacterium]
MSKNDMPESNNQKNSGRSIDEKSIPEHIIDGSIVIDSIEAFSSILKQFPKHPSLLIKYADLLFRQELIDLAAKSYGEAAQLYIDSGHMLQAMVAKKQQWLIKPPSKDDIFFGEIYPFNKDQTCKSDIKTVTQVELVKISRQKLMKLCRDFPNIEMALIDLFKIRSSPQESTQPSTLRKADRYQLPIKMNLELAPKGTFKNPLVVDGYSSDISIGGICVVLNGHSEHIGHLLATLPETADSSKIRVSFPGETMELKVWGNIKWRHEIHFNGRKTLALGIRFQEDSPKLRGMLFMFANSLGGPKVLSGAS